MKRLTDPDECREVTRNYPKYFTFDEDAWFEDNKNYAFIEGRNVGFAEYKSPGSYWVHFCYDEARGRDAITLTKRMLEELCSHVDVTSCVGLIVLENKKARWLIRKVGFKSLGEVDTKNGLCEMFYWIKENNGTV